MNERMELTDELLVQALRQRTDVPVPSGLLSRVMAGATGTPRERTSRRWFGADGSRPVVRLPMPAIAGAAVAVAILVAVIALRPVFNVPGTTPAPAPSAAEPTPEARVVGDHAGLRLRLGNGVAPIDVIGAFGSIWIADIRAGDVRRFDPLTMDEIARIPVPGGGPAWFVEADGAIWVANQLGAGLTRIDPATNTVVARVGTDPTCGAPILLDGVIWQAACDRDVYLRIDPAANAVLERVPAEGHTFLIDVGGAFITGSPDGFARFDADARTFTELPAYAGPSGSIAFSDGSTFWVPGATETLRIDPSDGRTIGTFPYLGVVAITFDGGFAYMTQGNLGIVKVDLAANPVVETIPMSDPWVARMANGYLWVTEFNSSALWRIDP